MFVDFGRLMWRNFLNYGNKPTKIRLEKGIHLLSGKNGDGKSTLIDAMCFCLFGVPYRKVKIKELVNRINKKKLYTEIEFRVNKKSYRIERTLNPDSVKIWEDSVELDLLSSKRLVQDDIDKIIGINHKMFRQIISLSISYNKPFLIMMLSEKRDIIESIFNIKIFGEMLKILKKENTGTKIKVDINKKSLDLLKENIKGMLKQQRDMKITIRDFEKNKT